MKTLSAESIYSCFKSEIEVMAASGNELFYSVLPIDGIECFLSFVIKEKEVIIIELFDFSDNLPIITDENELKLAIINHFR